MSEETKQAIIEAMNEMPIEDELAAAKRDVQELAAALESNLDLAWVYLQVNPEGNLDRELEPKRQRYEASMALLARIRGDHAAEPAAPAPDVAALIELLLNTEDAVVMITKLKQYQACFLPENYTDSYKWQLGATATEALQALAEQVKKASGG